MSQGCLCIFGEVLFDHFPDGTHVLGGAPFNVAWHLQAFGQEPRFISRVGNDPEGEAVREAMRDWGMSTDDLQLDPQLPTGRVKVTFIDGEPEYDIVQHCAYDAISTELAELNCHLFYHGSLALREATSQRTVDQLRIKKPGIVFVDVNLRAPWWQREQILHMVSTADWAKLNSDELNLLCPTGEVASFIADYKLKGLVLTHGAAGAEVISAAGEHIKVQPIANTSVVDTVGAGDAFASVMILGLIKSWELDVTAQRAQAFASGLVANRGATVSDPGFYSTFIKDWQL